MAKNSYQRQFKKGTMPQQPTDPDSPLNQNEPASPSKQRKRNGVALGFQTQANPGLVGDSDYPRKGRK